MSVVSPDVRNARPAGELVTLSIDGRQVSVPRGTTVLRAALQAGIYIPHLCDFKDLAPYAGCRMCLVDIEKMRGVDTSCTIQAREGMVVRTDTPAIREYQRSVLEVILSDHPDRCFTCNRYERCEPLGICQRDDLVLERCLTCAKNRQCELQRVSDFLGLRQQRFENPRRVVVPERSNPFIEVSSDHCILCTRCTRVCDEIIGASAIDLSRRGRDAKISVQFKKELTESPCIYCGACAEICPTGALVKTDVAYGRTAEATVPSVCAHCGLGCGMFYNLRHGANGDRIVNVSGDWEDPASGGYTCVRGTFGYEFVASRDRLTTPLVKEHGEYFEATWDEALDLAAKKLAEARSNHGGSAVAVLGSGKTTNEEAYLLGKLARAVLGTNNLDHSAGQVVRTPGPSALRDALGQSAMTMPVADLAASGCILLLGGEIVETHPVAFMRIHQAVKRGARLILVDAKKDPTLARHASIWLRPRPGAEVVVLNALLKIILDEGLEDKAFVADRSEGLDALRASLAAYTPERASALAGVPAEDLVAAARLFATGGADKRHPIPASWRGLFMTAGLQPRTQNSAVVYPAAVAHTVRWPVVPALVNLALATGMIGKQGAGIAALTKENNSQGASDMGVHPDYLPGYRALSDDAARAEVAAVWGVEPPTARGLALSEILEGIEAGAIKALYVVGSNPLRGAPDADRWTKALERLDCLVVQDLFPNSLTALADVVFPAASLAEKEGTTTSTERRVQRIRQAVRPVGESLPDWQIIRDLGGRLADQLESLVTFDYASPAEIFAEATALVADYSGLSHQALDAATAGVQWPAGDTASGTAHLGTFATPSGRARFAPAVGPTVVPASGLALGLVAETQFSAGTLADHSRRLRDMRGKASLVLSAEDAAAAGVAEGDLVSVIAAQGEVELVASISRHAVPGLALAHLPGDEAKLLGPLAKNGGKAALEAGCLPVRVRKA